jgi:NADH-quinone oxidoreductase subunit E/NADP-reducing hydrogenase subunit HndA
LIHVLHKAQSIFTYLPLEVQLFIARQLDLPAAEVFGVVSFYSYFTTKPVGRHTISVCLGTACFVRGAEEVFKAFMDELGIKPGEITPDGLFSIKDVRCIGACGLAPVVTVGEKVYGHVGPGDVKAILDEYRADQVLEDLN